MSRGYYPGSGNLKMDPYRKSIRMGKPSVVILMLTCCKTYSVGSLISLKILPGSSMWTSTSIFDRWYQSRYAGSEIPLEKRRISRFINCASDG